MMQTYTTAVIGGGASGIIAALTAARAGNRTVLLEKTPRLGRKVLASGNGRCNLSNDSLDVSGYNKAARHLVASVFARFGKDAITRFFTSLGVSLYTDHHRIFPATNQSATVVKALELALARTSVSITSGFDVTGVASERDGFIVTGHSGRKLSANKIVIATGGRSYPSFGSNGAGYALARSLGHTVVAPIPTAVPLVTKHSLCQPLQGQKIPTVVRAIIGGSCEAETSGELLFTKYGLSGTAILDVSRPVSIAIHRLKKKSVEIAVDLVPFMNAPALRNEIADRIDKRWIPTDLLTGILPNKFGPALATLLNTKKPDRIAAALKDMRFIASGTRGWNEADFTAGGIDTGEVTEKALESKIRPGLYFCGEVLDVDGKRGGYNLAWAWASGHVAGLTGCDT